MTKLQLQRLGRTALGCGLLIVLAAGCGQKGPPLTSVKGKVTHGGQPLKGAHVMFTPSQGAPSGGQTDDNGAYELKYTSGAPGAMPGKHAVRITVPSPEPPPPMGGKPAPPPPPPPLEFHKDAEVKSGETNEINFDFPK